LNTDSKTIIQCDFDGTVTLEDGSFAILDACVPGKWRPLFEEYQEGRLTVGEFNSRAFSMVRAERESLLKIVSEQVMVRDGFSEFVHRCRERGYDFVIVSNGLDFYIRHILETLGLPDIEFHASITEFRPSGLAVRHKGPDGSFLDSDVKAAYTEHYLDEGYRVVYVGDGRSDLLPASKCSRVFATGPLVEYCRQANVECIPFNDFYEIIRNMES
jgi:2-hydroxy-3-keto-5-methylthiopentenyl-1-phosphate phosphatase